MFASPNLIDAQNKEHNALKVQQISKDIDKYKELLKEQPDNRLYAAKIEALQQRLERLHITRQDFVEGTKQANEKIDEINKKIIEYQDIALGKLSDIQTLLMIVSIQYAESAKNFCRQQQILRETVTKDADKQISIIRRRGAELREDINFQAEQELQNIKQSLEIFANQAREAMLEISKQKSEEILKIKDLNDKEEIELKEQHNRLVLDKFKDAKELQDKLYEQLKTAASKLGGGGLVNSVSPNLCYNSKGFAYIEPGTFKIEGKGIKDPAFWELFSAAIISTTLIVGGIAAMVATAGAATPLVAVGWGAASGACLGGGMAGMSYTYKSGVDGTFQWGNFGKTVGVAMATGAVTGAVAGGAGCYLNGMAGPNATILTKLGIGAITGSSGGAASKVTSNLLTGRPIYEGLLCSIVTGAASGAVGAGAGMLGKHICGNDVVLRAGFGMGSGAVTSAGSGLLKAMINGEPVNVSELLGSIATGAIIGGISAGISAHADQQKSSQQKQEQEATQQLERKIKEESPEERVLEVSANKKEYEAQQEQKLDQLRKQFEHDRPIQRRNSFGGKDAESTPLPRAPHHKVSADEIERVKGLPNAPESYVLGDRIEPAQEGLEPLDGPGNVGPKGWLQKERDAGFGNTNTPPIGFKRPNFDQRANQHANIECERLGIRRSEADLAHTTSSKTMYKIIQKGDLQQTELLSKQLHEGSRPEHFNSTQHEIADCQREGSKMFIEDSRSHIVRDAQIPETLKIQQLKHENSTINQLRLGDPSGNRSVQDNTDLNFKKSGGQFSLTPRSTFQTQVGSGNSSISFQMNGRGHEGQIRTSALDPDGCPIGSVNMDDLTPNSRNICEQYIGIEGTTKKPRMGL